MIKWKNLPNLEYNTIKILKKSLIKVEVNYIDYIKKWKKIKFNERKLNLWKWKNKLPYI